VIHIGKDLGADGPAWYLRSTPVWLAVMVLGSSIFWFKMAALRRAGVDVGRLFRELPEE
jgi:hypothetical protein